MTLPTLTFTNHANDGKLALGLSTRDVQMVVAANDVIEPAETPTSGRLIFGIVNDKPVHVVARRFDSAVELIITVYEPNNRVFEDDLRTRRKKGK